VLSLDDRIVAEFQSFCDYARKLLPSLTIDLKSLELLLQETMKNWNIYHDLSKQLEKWLNESEQVLRRSAEDRFVSVRAPSGNELIQS
jgi:inhibitor of KinA sporulation pathway (predicted exonuclease)